MGDITGSFFNTLTRLLNIKSKSKKIDLPKRKPGRIPAYIFTGFLGSGKTTCINQILNSTSGIRFGVIVNDFGSINIDKHLIEGTDGQIIALENGCICCTLRNSLSDTITSFLSAEYQPDTLVIEASGVADPAGIISLLEGEELRKKVRIAGVICLVDAEGINSVSWIMSHQVRKQIKSADLILLNKVDRVSAAAKNSVIKEWIPQNTPVLETEYAALPVTLLLGTSHVIKHDQDPSGNHTDHHHIHDEHGFSTISWTSTSPIRLSCLQSLMKNLPTSIIRAKGLAYLDEFPTQQVIIQVVGKRVSVTKGRSWSSHQPSTMLTFIGIGDNIKKYDLSNRLQSCVVNHN